MYRIKVTEPSVGQLQKLTPDIQRRIIKKLEFFVSNDNPLSYAEHLTNFKLGHYRFRIGDYRVIIDVVEDKIIVLAVGHRREIYK